MNWTLWIYIYMCVCMFVWVSVLIYFLKKICGIKQFELNYEYNYISSGYEITFHVYFYVTLVLNNVRSNSYLFYVFVPIKSFYQALVMGQIRIGVTFSHVTSTL